MTISPVILGDRLKSLRKHLGLRQGDIAKDLEVHQNVISRLEAGKGGNLEVFLKLINYFGDFFYLDNLLSGHFMIVELSNLTDKEKMEGVAIERLNLFKTLMDEEIGKIVNLLER